MRCYYCPFCWGREVFRQKEDLDWPSLPSAGPAHEGPPLQAILVDNEVEPVAVGVSAWLGKRANAACAEALDRSGHRVPP